VLVGLVDVLGSPGGVARLSLWLGWGGSFLVLFPFQTRGPPWAAVVSGALAGVVSMLVLLAMSWMSGGSHSVFFLIVMMIPLMSALVASSDTADPVIQGIIGLVGGGAIMRTEGRPWSEVLPWATLAGIATAFALFASLRARRRLQALLLSEQARVAALERLAAAERWAALGQLADRVAHDVNSPLASIRSNLSFLARELRREDGEVQGAIEDGLACSDRIRTSIATLQARLRLPSDEDGRSTP